MSVTGSGQTRNPFTLHLVSIITVSVATFFPYTTSMARVYYTHTQKSYRNSWWKSRHRTIWLIAVILPTQNAGSIHIDRQYPRASPKKEEKASWQTDRVGGILRWPPTVGVSYFHWGERKQVGHRYWAQSGVVRCRLDSDSDQQKCSFIATCSSFSQSVRLLYGATCVCAAKDIVSELSISFFLIIWLICFSSTPRSTKEKNCFHGIPSRKIWKKKKWNSFFAKCHRGKK